LRHLEAKCRHRREELATLSTSSPPPYRIRNDLVPKLAFVECVPSDLAVPARNVRQGEANPSSRARQEGGSRSNVWTYPGARLGSEARDGLQHHPTVKPVAMLEDALLDMTERGDIVIDPFLGSGSTLIACEKTGRRCRGVELDPLYIEVMLRRYEAVTGQAAVLESTGETYVELAVRRQREAEHRAHPHSDEGARVSAS
jgi:DNA modification methylase